jgi:hypothetical protein
VGNACPPISTTAGTFPPIDLLLVVGVFGVIDDIEEGIESRNATAIFGRAMQGTFDQSWIGEGEIHREQVLDLDRVLLEQNPIRLARILTWRELTARICVTV